MEAVLYNLGDMVYQDFDLHLLTGYFDHPDILSNYYTIHQHSSFCFDPANLVYARKACNKFIKHHNPILLMNIAQPQTLGFSVAQACQKHHVKSLVRMTGDTFREANLYTSPIKRIKAWLLFSKFAYSAFNRADYILAIGKKIQESLIDKKINPDKIHVLPQPFNMEAFASVSEAEKLEIKKRIGVQVNRKTILFVGRLTWAKGADLLLEIIDKVERLSDKFQFLIVGQGEFSKTLRRYPEKLVKLPGNVSRQEVALYYQAADLFVFPSRTEGGLPNVILEALASQLPVIASTVGDIPNWVSQLSTEPQEYADYILSENWTLDKLPDHVQYEHLKKEYISFLNKIIRD